MEPIKYVYDETSIPTNFDARTKWPNKIHPVQNQEWCGSDWAFTTSAITGLLRTLLFNVEKYNGLLLIGLPESLIYEQFEFFCCKSGPSGNTVEGDRKC